MKSCKTCAHPIDPEEGCTAPSPCVDESWHSWTPKDKMQKYADKADHDREAKK